MPRAHDPIPSDLRVMLHPASGFAEVRGVPIDAPRWVALRRPLMTSAVLGCAISLMTEGSLTLRLALPGAIEWSFVPLLQVAWVAVAWRGSRREVSLARAIDLSFIANGPWLLWLLAYASVWGFFAPVRVYGWVPYHWVWHSVAGLFGLWSLYIDIVFFRLVLGRTWTPLFYRAAWWLVIAAVFVAPAAWQELAGWLGI